MKFIIFSVLFFNTIFASNCQDTFFAFDIPNKSSKVKIIDIVENMAYECRFSVKIKDDKAKEQLENILFLVHIENYTLQDMFRFLFTQNNIFYKYNSEKSLLSISYLETKSFVIDYVNLSNFTTKSTKNINVGTSSSNDNSSSSSSSDTSSSSSSSAGNSDSTVVVSSSEFKFWDNLSDEINEILARDGDYSLNSKAIINKEAGVVTITGTSNQVVRVEKYLNKLKDRLHKQVLLEAKLIEVSYEDVKSNGIDWSKFQLSVNGEANTNSWATLVDNITNSGGASDASIAYNFSISGLLNFLDSYGDVNVLSTPKIMTLNNQPAVINVGNQRNYEYLISSITNNSNTAGASVTNNIYGNGSTFIGLTLNIVPEITESGYVILRINPVISEKIEDNDILSNSTTASLRSAPDIRIKQLSSIVKAKNGARVIIGGLVSYTKTINENKVQGLGDIPILGYAFRSDKTSIIKKELIIVITPTIIDYNKFPSINSIEASMREF